MSPRSPWQSTLLVLLFYCGLPRCCLMSSATSDLRLFRYLLRITYASYFLLRTPFSDWLSFSRACPYSFTNSAAEFQPHYIYGASSCIVSLVSSTHSCVVSILTPLREPTLERPFRRARASLCSSLSLTCDGTSNLVALVFRARAPFVFELVCRHRSSVLRLAPLSRSG